MGALYPLTSTIRPVNPVLQGRVIGYFNSDDSYIADQVLPKIGGVGKTGTIMNVGRASGFGDVTDNLLRHYKSRYHRNAGPTIGNATWNCEEYGDEALVDLRQLADADVGIDLEFLESQVAIENLRIWRERRAASLLFNTTTFTQNVTLAGNDQWSSALSDPMDDIDVAVRTVYASIGKAPNTFISGFLPGRTIRKNASVLSFRPTNTDRNMLTDEQFREILKSMFGIDNVFVGNAHYNTANQAQTVALSPVWGDMVWIGYMDYGTPGTTLGSSKAAVGPSAAVQLVAEDLTSEEYEAPEVRSKVLRHRHEMDELVTSAISGYIINDITA